MKIFSSPQGHCGVREYVCIYIRIYNALPMVNEKTLSLFVKNTLVFEEEQGHQKTVLPFFADGYPGLIYCRSESGLKVRPHQKDMPELFLYGQTIKPVELLLEGRFKLVIMQLYPFVIRSFFKLEPRTINDNCFDLRLLESREVHAALNELSSENSVSAMVTILSKLLQSIFENRRDLLDYKIREAIQLILDGKGQTTVGSVTKTLKITPRTFERRFLAETGISAKQFAQITQFNDTFQQLSSKQFKKLTELVYANGFADQSHFTRVFKKFTGKTPKAFK
jgi:AraC-like DNA-binding protein